MQQPAPRRPVSSRLQGRLGLLKLQPHLRLWTRLERSRWDSSLKNAGGFNPMFSTAPPNHSAEPQATPGLKMVYPEPCCFALKQQVEALLTPDFPAPEATDSGGGKSLLSGE